MPDPWEYPWYAAWDLAFHCVPIAHVDPEFAKAQLLLVLREWYMHPNGQIPAYEWAFGDVNPPVHAWAALRVFEIDGSRDHAFLAQVFHKLLLNFTWWVNRKDSDGSNVFEGGFLGLDNIGPIDRSAPLPVAARLEQSDGTAWMAMYALNLLEMALVLAEHDRTLRGPRDQVLRALRLHRRGHVGRWVCGTRSDGFFYDVLRLADGSTIPLRVRSMVGLIPLCATTTLGTATLDAAAGLRRPAALVPREQAALPRGRRGDARARRPRGAAAVGRGRRAAGADPRHDALRGRVPLAARAARPVPAAPRRAVHAVDLAGAGFTVDYEPGESTNGLFGGNSNWRGPVWFPVNYLVIEAVRRYARFFGDDVLRRAPGRLGAQSHPRAARG